eukprot:m.27909 g.27909  ORF g.27909 m.27909 type:complete len:239 (-) comp8997_c0_seq3:183-899(-)
MYSCKLFWCLSLCWYACNVDVCNMISFKTETFALFDESIPKNYMQPRPGKRTIWPPDCPSTRQVEVESGQILLNKRVQWKALNMIYFMNRHSDFFLKQLFHGDKMTFHYGFVAAKSTYGLVPFPPASVGVESKFKGRKLFCGNTLGQKHPDKDEILFMHRNSAKFKDASSYFLKGEPKHVWRHVNQQGEHDPYQLVFRGEIGDEYFAGEDAGTHHECLSGVPGELRQLRICLTECMDA